MTDTQREFEKWATNHRDVHSICYFTLKKENGNYISGMTNDAWEGYQAGFKAALAHSQIDKKQFVHKLAELKNSKHISSDAHALILSMLFPITNRKDE